MTEQEIMERLNRLTNGATDEDTVTMVDEIMGEFRRVAPNAEQAQRIEQLKTELANEKERFKKRFWGGEVEQQEGSKAKEKDGRDYGEKKASELMNDFFKDI